MTDLRDLIAETLAGHRLRHSSLVCMCGQEFDYGGSVGDVFREHHRHVAAVLLAALGDRVLPEGGETRQEWAYTEVRGGERPYLLHHTCCRWTPNIVHHHQFTRFVTAWPAAPGPNDEWARYVGPWLPVDTEETPDPCRVCDGRGFYEDYDPVVGRMLQWPCAACRQTGVAS